jgi:protein kinase-like protein/WD40 repeat protein
MSNPSDWSRVKDVLHAALAQPPDERALFVRDACREDHVLRQEVESLLAAHAQAAGFAERPAIEGLEQLAMVGAQADAGDHSAMREGDRFGGYVIEARLGAGGMGEVYRALDTTLGRQVAIKVLPNAFLADPERRARLEREARVLAALNHPHIGGIYGLEDVDGVRALVLELVDGETLAERLASGPLALNEALAVARQIAGALEAAHEKGIVHRDLKPANIKITAEGVVKVLDFGLAKASGSGAAALDVPQSPLITVATHPGVLIGTAAYMSPEQARGQTVDKRADIWAFGCVLYEMLTGSCAFVGDGISATLASVLKSDPDWNTLSSELPATIRTILTRSLVKDSRQRLADISIVLFLLNESGDDGFKSSARPIAPSVSRLNVAVSAAAAATVVFAICVAVAWRVWPDKPRLTVTRFSIGLGEGQEFFNTGRRVLNISPDGTQIVYVANQRLYHRLLSEGQAKPIPGTEEQQLGVVNPVFSPDGASIAFYAPADNVLKRIAVAGGSAVTLCPATYPDGVAWSGDAILFGQAGRGIVRVPATGGTPEVIVPVRNGERAHGPQLLPGGQAVLFTVATGAGLDMWDRSQIVIASLKTGVRKTVVSGGSDARYLPTGHLVYAVGGVVFGHGFDLARMDVVGNPVPVIEGVARADLGNNLTAVTQFSSAENGTLIYVSGAVSPSMMTRDVVFVDRQSLAVQPVKLPPALYEYPRLSPDGRSLAVGTDDGNEAIIWVYDLSGASARRRLTFGGRNRFPVWSPDSQRVSFTSDRDGDLALFWQRADAAGPSERLTRPALGTSHVPQSWAPDGKTLLFRAGAGSTFSLWTLSIINGQIARYDTVETSKTISAAFSPDGRWVAYDIGDLTMSLFVQPFPVSGTRHQFVALGFHPFWSADGKELFFSTVGPRLFAVSFERIPSLRFGDVRPIATNGLLGRGSMGERNMDVTPDGKRLVGILPSDQVQAPASRPQINVVENWFEELKARVPTR